MWKLQLFIHSTYILFGFITMKLISLHHILSYHFVIKVRLQNYYSQTMSVVSHSMDVTSLMLSMHDRCITYVISTISNWRQVQCYIQTMLHTISGCRTNGCPVAQDKWKQPGQAKCYIVIARRTSENMANI